MKRADVVIIGAGMSGICMAIKLQEAGITDFIVLEKNSEVGGTWHDNTYPGACCDVPAILYSYSFEPNPDWSQVCPPQQEVQQYFLRCVEKYQLRRYIQFNSEVASAQYLETEGRWLVSLFGGEQINARVVITGLGQLNLPYTPDFEGADKFNGPAFHTARWNPEVDLTGKRVAVIGNAASAIQLVPRVAEKAAQLYIYQRSANYIIARNDHPYGALTRAIFGRFPLTQKIVRLCWYLRQEFVFFGAMIPGTLRSRLLTWMAKRYLKTEVKDPGLRETLTPDYVLGCKRALVSDDYYQSLNNDNVEIVTSAIQGINEDGVGTEDNINRPVDVIVYATGFRSTEMLAPMQVVGEKNLDLNVAWKEGAEAHRGVALSGFPNFYMLYGPNTNLGHNSIIFMAERQVEYILQCIQAIFDDGLKCLQPKKAVQKSFNEAMQRDLANRVWAGECGSWYKNDSGKIINNWPHSTMRFAREMRRVDFNEYEKA